MILNIYVPLFFPNWFQFIVKRSPPNGKAVIVLAIFNNNMINGETIRLDGAVRLAPR